MCIRDRSKPILAVISVYTIVGTWNSWFSALVYLPRTDWQPLQLFLRRILVESTRQVTEILTPELAAEMMRKQMSGAQLKYAMIIFTTLPILFTYPFFQKYFVKGVMPVSYTHLDVYKRQQHMFPIRNCGTIGSCILTA